MTTREFKFTNGDKVKEKITGFTGIITGTAFYITGCNQYLVIPKSPKPHESPDGVWYDEERLDLIRKQDVNLKDTPRKKENGPDIPAPGGKRGC
jgi:hypothetical protein